MLLQIPVDPIILSLDTDMSKRLRLDRSPEKGVPTPSRSFIQRGASICGDTNDAGTVKRIGWIACMHWKSTLFIGVEIFLWGHSHCKFGVSVILVSHTMEGRMRVPGEYSVDWRLHKAFYVSYVKSTIRFGKELMNSVWGLQITETRLP